jgi:RNA polymerase subunit RPABC4/transcription elongation factor Spt4
MAQVKCKECKTKFLSTETKCPECGGEKSTSGGLSSVEMVMVVLMAFGCIAAKEHWNAGHEQRVAEEAAQEAAKAAEEVAACKTNLQCWGDKFGVASDIACGPAVERLAKYSFRWTTGTLDTKFPSFKWLDRPSGYLTYIGDRVEFQNGFGAYQNMIYTCDYDPIGKRVINVSVKPGRR